MVLSKDTKEGKKMVALSFQKKPRATIICKLSANTNFPSFVSLHGIERGVHMTSYILFPVNEGIFKFSLLKENV